MHFGWPALTGNHLQKNASFLPLCLGFGPVRVWPTRNYPDQDNSGGQDNQKQFFPSKKLPYITRLLYNFTFYNLACQDNTPKCRITCQDNTPKCRITCQDNTQFFRKPCQVFTPKIILSRSRITQPKDKMAPTITISKRE
jgi:hypothetical protein